MAYFIRTMLKKDIPQVSIIDREAFPTMFPPPNFERELRNQMTHFYVVCDDIRQVDETEISHVPARNSSLINRLRKWFYQDGAEVETLAVEEPVNYICGYVGFWVMADEAHITTIAVRDELHRKGIGELLMITAIEQARRLHANVVTLEVRVSNTGAQKLYEKYGFNQAGVRKGYYTDNREDAYIMTTGDINSSEYRKQIDHLGHTHSGKWGKARLYTR